MIWNSKIWKDELKIELKNFEKYLIDVFNHEYGMDHFNLGLEKFYFVSSFIIRKLIESNKLSDEMEKKKYPCDKYLRINSEKILDRLNSHQYGEFYDLMKPQKCELTPRFICNMFIHSFAFFPTYDEDEGMKFLGVFVNSDYSKDKCIYHIGYDEVIELINDVIDDDIGEFSINRLTGEVHKSNLNV